MQAVALAIFLKKRAFLGRDKRAQINLFLPAFACLKPKFLLGASERQSEIPFFEPSSKNLSNLIANLVERPAPLPPKPSGLAPQNRVFSPKFCPKIFQKKLNLFARKKTPLVLAESQSFAIRQNALELHVRICEALAVVAVEGAVFGYDRALGASYLAVAGESLIEPHDVALL